MSESTCGVITAADRPWSTRAAIRVAGVGASAHSRDVRVKVATPTRPPWTCSVLRRSGPPYTLSTRDLAGHSLVTAGAISQRVARAERDKLVTRRPAPGRSRAVLVELTPVGHELVERTVDRVLTRETQLLERLGPERREALAELLRELLDDVQEELNVRGVSHVGHEGLDHTGQG